MEDEYDEIIGMYNPINWKYLIYVVGLIVTIIVLYNLFILL